MALIDRPLACETRKIGGLQPRKVLHHFGTLVENKEDTEQVFHIIEATKGRKSVRQAWDFIASGDGQRFLRDEVDIPAMLDDHDRWKKLPRNTVGRHYVDFMKREGLSAAGLVAESHKWAPPDNLPQDLTQWYFDRLRDTHDLFHILTGYGRDALGEACLLGFSYSQHLNRGLLFIAYAGGREISRATQTRAPILRAVREGQRNGKAAQKLAHMDVAEVMRTDIDKARAQLGIRQPQLYRKCLDILASEGIDNLDIAINGKAAA